MGALGGLLGLKYRLYLPNIGDVYIIRRDQVCYYVPCTEPKAVLRVQCLLW